MRREPFYVILGEGKEREHVPHWPSEGEAHHEAHGEGKGVVREVQRHVQQS